jgi:transposase InsO family protein
VLDGEKLDLPAASTVGALLKREGLVLARRKRLRAPSYTHPLAHAEAPNQVWCADFKGWFRCGMEIAAMR